MKAYARIALVAAALCAVVAGCTQHRSDESVKNLLALSSPGQVSGGVGYVDMDKVVDSHPLHPELQALQDQITALNAQAVVVPQAATPEQRVVETTLARAAADAEAHRLEPPAVIAVGPVVRLRAGLDWIGAALGRRLDPDPLGTRAQPTAAERRS